MIGIVDYGMGNLRSVHNALTYLGCSAELVSSPEQIRGCDRLILPGVGAYAKAMDNLTPTGLGEAVRAHVAARKPLLGICLGMQLLSSKGFEPYPCQGLGLVDGEVNMLQPPAGLELPHVGWNSIELKIDHALFKGVKRSVDFYFVHSYQFLAARPQDVVATTDYGGSFVSVVAHENVIGVQFHPEKSQENGLRLLENFSQWDGAC